MADIAIGYAVIDRAGAENISGLTVLSALVTATDSGVINTVEVWADVGFGNMTNTKVGMFYLISGTTYKCRSVATIGTVVAGSKQTFTQDTGSSPLALVVASGDLIGILWESPAKIERDTTGSGGFYYYAGDVMIVGAQQSFTFSSTKVISLGGSGVTLATGQQILGSRFLRGLKNFDK